MPVTRIPDNEFDRLKALAEPLVDSVGDVISRLINSYYENSKAPKFPLKDTELRPFWLALERRFNDRKPRLFAHVLPDTGAWCQVRTGRADAHYEWLFHKNAANIDVSVHFEDKNRETNARRLKDLMTHEQKIVEGVMFTHTFGQWKSHPEYSHFSFKVPYQNGAISEGLVDDLATTMNTLIERTWTILINC